MDTQPNKTREQLLKAALEKAKSKSIPESAFPRWDRQELKNLLKSKRRNPFIAPKSYSQAYQLVKCLGNGASGAAAATLLDRYAVHQAPEAWHLPAHAAVAASSLLLPWSGFGGAAFYGLISESYYRFIVKGILAKAKSATGT